MFENSAKSTVLYRELKYAHIIKGKMFLNHKSSVGKHTKYFLLIAKRRHNVYWLLLYLFMCLFYISLNNLCFPYHLLSDFQKSPHWSLCVHLPCFLLSVGAKCYLYHFFLEMFLCCTLLEMQRSPKGNTWNLLLFYLKMYFQGIFIYI